MYSTKRLLLLLLLLSQLFGANWFQKDSIDVAEEEVYLSFRYQGVVDAIVVAYYDGENFYLPITELFEYFAINYTLEPSKFMVTGYFIKEDMQYILDFSRRFAKLKDEVWTIQANDYLVKELDFYVTPKVFKEVFGLDLNVDLSRLSIELTTKQILPIVTRHKGRYREELRRKYSDKTSDEFYDLAIDRNQRMLDGAIVDYHLTNRVSDINKSSSLSLQVGGEVLYGDLQGNIATDVSQDTTTMGASDVRWRYVNESTPWFSSVVLGQQSTIGLLNRTFQGAQVNNEPLVPLRSYDTYAIDGTTEPEAEVELYQDGRLAEVTKSDDVGYYRFLVPLTYGTSNFQIRIYAKQGRIIELDRQIQVPFYFLPASEIRYGLIAGKLATASLDWEDQEIITSGSVTMGLTNWLTGGLGIEYVEQNNSDQPVFYSRISSRLASDILVNIDAVFDNYTRLTLKGIGPNSSSFSSDYSYYQQTNLYNAQGLKHQLNSNIFYPFAVGSMRFTGTGRMVFSNRADGKNSILVSTGLNQFVNKVRLRYGISEDHSFGTGGHVGSSNLEFGMVYSLPRIPSIHPWLRGSYYRLDLSYNSRLGAMNYLRLQYIKNFNQRLKFQTFINRDFSRSISSVEVSLSWDVNVVRTNTSVRTVGPSTAFNQTIRGSMALDRNNGQFIWDNRQQVGRSGMSVRMYVDDNSSGAYEVGEEILPGNALTIERASSRQVVKNGIPYLTQLQPYRRYNFRVNEARINNPILVPTMKQFSVITDPNRFKEVDVAFIRTGVIDGRVDRYKDGELVPIAGLRVHVKQDDGNYEVVMRTFADGSYYSMEIPPVGLTKPSLNSWG